MRRLLEDPQLPLDLREALRRSQSAGHSYDIDTKLPQMREAWSQTHAPAGDLGHSTLHSEIGKTLSHTGLRIAWRTIPTGWKLAAMVAFGSGVAGVVQWSLRPNVAPLSDPSQQHPTPVSAGASAPVSPPQRRSLETHAVESRSSDTETAEQVPQSSSRTEDLTVTTSKPASGQEPGAESTAIRREIAYLVNARNALATNPQAAKHLMERSRKEFPNPILAEERDALLIRILLRTGDHVAAQVQARAFLTRYPHSSGRAIAQQALRE